MRQHVIGGYVTQLPGLAQSMLRVGNKLSQEAQGDLLLQRWTDPKSGLPKSKADSISRKWEVSKC